MIQQSSAKIFLSQERGKDETSLMRSYKTFNSGNFFNEHKAAFGNLFVLNDETLNSGATTKFQIEEECYIVLIPVVGGIIYSDSVGNGAAIISGEAHVVLLHAGTQVSIQNPYAEHLVNYIQLWFKPAYPYVSTPVSKTDVFNIDKGKNRLQDLFAGDSTLPFRLTIAKFDGRTELLYEQKNKKGGVYIYVIEGAFEVQYRLMHERDGLAIWDQPKIEAEALSNNAILSIAEVLL